MAIKRAKDVLSGSQPPRVSGVRKARDVLESLPATGRTGDEYQQYADAMKSSRVMEIEAPKKAAEQKRFNDNTFGATNKLKETVQKNRVVKFKQLTNSPLRENPITPLDKTVDDMRSLDAKLAAGAVEYNKKKALEDATKPTYRERVVDKVNGWPQILRPLAVPIAMFEETPFSRAVAQRTTMHPELHANEKRVGGLPGLAADVAIPLTVPGAGLGGTQLYNSAGNLLQRIAPSLENSLGGRIAGEAVKGAATGAPLSVGATLATNPDASGKELLQSAEYGMGGGAVLGGLGPVVGSLGKKIFKAAREALGGSRSGVVDSLARDVPEATRAFSGASELSAQHLTEHSVIPQEAPKVVKAAEPIKNNIASTARVIESPKESWFNKLFGNQGVGITPGSRSGRELIDTHVVSNPREPVALLERAGEIKDTAKQDYVDRFAPFKKIDQETYDAAMDSTRANNLANVTIKDKFVDLEGNVIGNSLKDVYSTLPRGQKYIADRYLIARDAINRMERNQKVYGEEKWFPQTSEEAAVLTTKLENQYPWLKQFGEEFNQFNRNRQDLWVQSGIASQNLIDTLRKTNPNYVNMFRQQPRRGLGGQLALNTSKSGFSGQKAPIKRAVGSSRKIIDPAQGMIETTASSYNAMMRNRAMQSLYEKVKADPEKYGGVMEIVEESADAKQSTIKAINDALAENGPDGIADLLNDEVNNLFKKAKQTGKTGDSIVTVMVQGEPVKMHVIDPSLLKAIDGITPNQLEGVMRVADAISRTIKHSATGVLAPFQGLRLAFRDLPIAFAQSKDKKRFMFDFSHALVSQIGDWLPSFVPGSERLGNLARRYYRAGGGYEAYLKGDSRIRSAARDITKDPLLSGRNLLKQAKKFNPLHPLKAVGDAMENIPRMAAYAADMRSKGWKATPENVRSAIDSGREATVNWSRRGAKTQGIEAFAPYTNSAIQGTYRIAKRFKEQPIAATALIVAIAGAKIAAYEKFKDDPDYQQRSKFDKGIPVSKTKDGKFVSLPVEPTEAYIADQVLNFYKWAKDKEKFPEPGENIQSGIEAIAPSLISGPVSALTGSNMKEAIAKTAGGTVLDPIIASATGKNYFGGDITPREYQDDPTSLQYNETTSAAGKWAAENLGMDAFTFDYLANKFGGDIAKIGMPLTSDVGKGDVEGNLIDQVNARVRLLEDPVMKNNISDDYYNNLKIVQDAKTISDRKGTPLPNWYQSAYDEVTSMKKNSVNKIVSDLNASKKEILRDMTLSAKERADKLRDVQREINVMRIQGIKRLSELGVKR